MSTFKTRGIVLKEINVGESDKLIVALLKEYGKVSISAKGARKSKSKFLSGTQIFSYSDFIIYNGNTFLATAQVDLIDNFFCIRNDYAKMCYGIYFLELCEKIILESMPCDEILQLLIKTLTVLSKDVIRPELIARIFEFKFLQYNGYTPETNFCSYCGSEPEDAIYFSEHGLCCKKCKSNESQRVLISEGTIYSLDYILNSETDTLFKFKVSDKILLELRRISELFINSHLDVNLKSLEFIKELEKS